MKYHVVGRYDARRTWEHADEFGDFDTVEDAVIFGQHYPQRFGMIKKFEFRVMDERDKVVFEGLSKKILSYERREV